MPKELDSAGILVIAAIALLLGAILSSYLATESLTKTTRIAYSETFDLTALGVKNGTGTIDDTVKVYPVHFKEAASGWRYDDETSADTGCSADDITTSITARNGTGTALADPTDIVRNTAGYVTFRNTLKLNGSTATNTTTLYGLYCPDGYMTVSWGRTMLNLAPGFFVLALLIIAVGYFYKIARDAEIF